jgi:hypothetical protein
MDENRLRLIKRQGKSDDPYREKVWIVQLENHSDGEVSTTLFRTKARAEKDVEDYIAERIHDYVDTDYDEAGLLQMSGRELRENVCWNELTGGDESLHTYEQSILD